MSDQNGIVRGVPQGSILGPLLFILFVNDLHLHLLNSRTCLYADDTNIYTSGKSIGEINTSLSKDMKHLGDWCDENDLCINVDKTKCMLVSTSQKHSHNADTNLVVNVNSAQIPVCASHKLLGVYVSNVLDWEEQIKFVCRQVNHSLSVLKRIKSFLPESARILYCNSCVLSHMDYCSTIWGNTTESELAKLHRLQKRAARMIFDDYTSPSVVLFKKLHWLPLKKRIEHNKAVLMYKCLNYHLPAFMSDLFTYRANSSYLLRSEEQNLLIVPRPRLEIFRHSFMYSGAKLWNSLPVSLRQSKSVRSFKKKSVEYFATVM